MFGFFRKKTLEDPQEAIRRGDYDAALTMYRKQLEQQPRQAARWHRKIAEALALAGRADEAVEAFLQAALLLERDAMHLQAIALYKAVLRLAPEHPRALERLAEYAPGEEERTSSAGAVEDATSMTIRTRLRKYAPLFSEFERDTLTAVVDVMKTHHIEAGHEIFRQGEKGDSLFVIADGEVALTVDGADGNPVELDRLNTGGCFGEVSALRRLPRNVTAMTTRPTELLELSRDYLEAVAIAHPQVWKVLEDFQQRRLVPVGI